MTSPEEKATLRERLAFLEKKTEALELEVSHLNEQNFRLSDQLELMRKINQKLKHKLTMNFNREPSSAQNPMAGSDASPLFQMSIRRAATILYEQPSTNIQDNSRTFNGQTLHPNPEKGGENKVHEKNGLPSVGMILDSLKEIDMSPLQPEPVFFPRDITGKNNAPILSLDTKKFQENHETYAQKIEREELNEIQQMLENVMDQGKFQEFNHLLKIGSYSPFSKVEMQKTEKYIDGTEHIVKNWVKQLEEMNKNCLAYSKSVESFGNQLLMDKSFFKNNVELQTLLTLIAQVLKEHAIYLDVFTQVVENSIENPLKHFYKETMRSYKEPKKKMQKLLEDFETHQTKFLSLKKASIFRETGGHSLQRAYINSLKAFETARLEQIHCLNGICAEINKELVQKLCTFVTGRMEHMNSSYEVLHGIEKQVNLFLNSIPKKVQIQDKLNQEFETFRGQVAENLYTHYERPSNQDIIKEGYVFIKMENKDFKKRYCTICEDGILYLVKDSEPGAETPQISELANLKLCNVKPKCSPEHPYCFELVDALMKKPILVQAESELTMNEWVNTIRNVIERALFQNLTTDDNSNSKKTVECCKGKCACQPTAVTLGNLESNSPEKSSLKGKQNIISEIINHNLCADCGAKDPSWVSLNLGVTLCINCSGVHRQFGANVSKVRSLKLDNLAMVVLRLFSKLPTEEVNKIWEGLHDEKTSIKPNPDSEKEKKIEYVKLKYVDKALVRSLSEEDHIEAICKAFEKQNLLKVLHVLAFTKMDLNVLYMIRGRKQTVLHYACTKGSPEIVELLLKNGCDVNAEDQDGCKPLDCAMAANQIEIMDHLSGKARTFEL